ncbi:MAG: LacI family DNA-binding transcriptional regulator [Chthonomonadales bacterium]|nr:LacI family DNA-binding transcriptional regulator [Chthonomonadales bacterium]
MAATLRDVARLAGTSVAAVSAVVSGSVAGNIRVSSATRARILAAAAELSYTPNLLARSLVTRKTGVLGLVFPYSSAFVDRNPFCTQVMAGVFEEVVRQKYNLMLHTAAGDDWNASDARTLIDPRVDGLLLVLPAPHSPVVAHCLRKRFPCVSILYAAESEQVCTVNAEDERGGRMATEHLLALGHRRLAHLCGVPGVASAEPRRRGYLAACAAARLPERDALVLPAGFDWHDGYRATLELLALPAGRRPSALFAANDLCAEGALRALREAGVRVPDDMAVVGYDNTWFAAMTQPALTSVAMPIQDMAVRATRILIETIEGREVADRQPVLPVSLCIRDSCGARRSGAAPETKGEPAC